MQIPHRIRQFSPPPPHCRSHALPGPALSMPEFSKAVKSELWRRWPGAPSGCRRQVVVVMHRGTARSRLALAAFLPAPSLLPCRTHPRFACARGGGSGKIKSRLHCTWAPRASYVGFIYNHIHFYGYVLVIEGSVTPNVILHCGMGLVPPSLVV